MALWNKCPVVLRCAGALSADSQAQLCGREQQTTPQPLEHTLIIDGLLGSGAVGELRPAYAALVRELNALRAASPRSLTLAIDIPTGLDAATGTRGADVVLADVTAAIGCVKPGMLADFVVLGEDPFTADPSAIKDIPILETYLGGKKVYPK